MSVDCSASVKLAFIVARMLVMPPMLFHRERVNEVRLLVYYISSLKATLHVYTELSITNQRLYLLSQLKAQGLPSDSLQIIFHT